MSWAQSVSAQQGNLVGYYELKGRISERTYQKNIQVRVRVVQDSNKELLNILVVAEVLPLILERMVSTIE